MSEEHLILKEENGQEITLNLGDVPVGNPLSQKQQLAQMRPTLLIGAGGSGQYILTFLKAMLEARFADEWQSRIRLLAFDTTEETIQVQGPHGLISLEPGSEFFDIGNIPVGSIMRNIDSQVAIKERLGSVLSRLPAGVLRSGSKQLRPFGLMALLWNHPQVNEQLRRALWQLAGRNQTNGSQTQQQGINVFICGSLVGGTGSGTTLDLAHLIREAFTDLGTQAEFCHITGIGVLPQAFYGIKGPNMWPNTAAYLQELNHLMVKGNFQARYPDGRLIQSREAPFNIYYVVDGVDQQGRTWSDIYAVSAMAAHCIYLQMGTQLGQKGENAFDNLDEVLTGLTHEGQGTFLASFGKGDLLFNAPAVAAICTHWLLAERLQTVWLAAADPEVVGQTSHTLLAAIQSDQMRPHLRQDRDTKSEFHYTITPPAWLSRLPMGEISSETTRYLAEFEQARLAETILPHIARNGQELAATQQGVWQEWVQAVLLSPEMSLNSVLQVIQQLQSWLTTHLEENQRVLVEQERQLSRLEQVRTQAGTAVSQAAASFPLGRQGRVREALAYTFRTAQELADSRISVHMLRAEQSVWHQLQQWLRQQLSQLNTLRERLGSLAQQVEGKAAQQLEQVAHGGVAAVSLADAAYVRRLYGRYKPNWVDIREQIPNPLTLTMLSAADLKQRLLATLQPAFTAIRELDVEQVIQDRKDEMSLRARRQQLFELATPSWNVDRARLPEGGANLVRLEVLGVPDATQSYFEGEPMLVSTHDPYRLTALVVAAGAPPLALQQYDQFMAAMEQAKGKRPLHILPDFLTTADQGRLLFALGSIFHLIYSQGTFFYYRPADPLDNPLKLANGLSNALEAFAEQEELVTEVNERIEAQIAQLGLRDAIQVLTSYYSQAPNGNTTVDDQLRELKRLVRDYTDSLRRIDAFNTGMNGQGRRFDQ
ncbi:MAG: hypothetical protein H6658_09760 [Ardenticatenaceae bacterium]|nr:hypothetical protein [Ardenticatenaceae bacterium]